MNAAEIFARAAHAGQVRKYTGVPYWHHCRNVAALVENKTSFEMEDYEDAVNAAWLHDTIEDTKITAADIAAVFGERVASIVVELTDDTTGKNRAARKAIDRARLSAATDIAQTVKCADLIDNTRSIVEHDPTFARVYLAEKRALLDVLSEADPLLREMAWETLEKAEKSMGDAS